MVKKKYTECEKFFSSCSWAESKPAGSSQLSVHFAVSLTNWSATVYKLSPGECTLSISEGVSSGHSPVWQQRTVAVTHSGSVWTLYSLASPIISLPGEDPTCLFNLPLTADCYAHTSDDDVFIHLLVRLSWMHLFRAAFTLFTFFLQNDTFFYNFFFLNNRHKRVFVHTCLPAERALREYSGELYLSEAHHLPPGIPDQQWHLWRYTAPYQHHRIDFPQLWMCCKIAAGGGL